MALRCTLKLRDGKVHAGYTPAFDPGDGSVWLTATPSSPAGTMFTLDRVRALVLEPMEGRAVALPQADQAPVAIQLDFADGERLSGIRRVDLPSVGAWIEPAGRPKARAFVPHGAASSVVLGRDGDSASWPFLESSRSLPPEPAPDSSPTDAHPIPSIPSAPSLASARSIPSAPSIASAPSRPAASPTPTLETSISESHTQPLLVPPRAPVPAAVPEETAKTTPDDPWDDLESEHTARG